MKCRIQTECKTFLYKKQNAKVKTNELKQMDESMDE
jgi:hypothetical protein